MQCDGPSLFVIILWQRLRHHRAEKNGKQTQLATSEKLVTEATAVAASGSTIVATLATCGFDDFLQLLGFQELNLRRRHQGQTNDGFSVGLLAVYAADVPAASRPTSKGALGDS